jgi:uncharacterized membrane protein YfbV (UPF0208 family)
MSSPLIAVLGSLVTLSIFVAGVIYKMGHHAARLESLENWRNNVRNDMHEISEKLELVSNQITNLTTLVEERTERRVIKREGL